MHRPLLPILAAIVLGFAVAPSARGDTAPTPFASWEGHNGYFLTGAALATDTNGDGSVDTRLTSASFDVTAADIPATATLLNAYLYWGGTQPNNGSADSSVRLALPNGGPFAVVPDVVYFADGGSMSYDMFLSRADVTSLFPSTGAGIIGRYTVGEYSGSIANRSTDNASTALLLVFEDPAAPRRRIVAHDGLLTMVRSAHVVSATELDASESPAATIAYYTLEGDIGNRTEEEFVRVTGQPSGLSMMVEDELNPRDNPMNRTINTTLPPQSGVVGVDIDRFDVSPALTAHDTSLDVAYSANRDKWWLALSVAEVTLSSLCLACDLNLDGAINMADLALLSAYYGARSMTEVLAGDLNVDGRVGLRDLMYLRSHLGESLVHAASPAVGVVVPEASTLLLTVSAIAVMLAIACRRRVDSRGKKKATAVERLHPVPAR